MKSTPIRRSGMALPSTVLCLLLVALSNCCYMSNAERMSSLTMGRNENFKTNKNKRINLSRIEERRQQQQDFNLAGLASSHGHGKEFEHKDAMNTKKNSIPNVSVRSRTSSSSSTSSTSSSTSSLPTSRKLSAWGFFLSLCEYVYIYLCTYTYVHIDEYEYEYDYDEFRKK